MDIADMHREDIVEYLESTGDFVILDWDEVLIELHFIKKEKVTTKKFGKNYIKIEGMENFVKIK
ncbi:MAG: hypothetical protein P8Y70_02950 [Candidatus Lokiarchaeota archaeon]